MGDIGQKLSTTGVRVILFLHGAIPGTDIFGLGRLDEVGGLKRGYSRGISGLDSLLSFMREGTNGITPLPGGMKPPLANDEATKNLLDSQIGDAGNFTTAHGRTMPESPESETRHTHHLSSGNSGPASTITSGRALAACRLLDRLRVLVARTTVWVPATVS
jgi:hypothetical protein